MHKLICTVLCHIIAKTTKLAKIRNVKLFIVMNIKNDAE